GQLPGDRDPRPDGGETVDGAEPQVRQPGEALKVRIDDERDDRDRPQPPDERVELPDRDEEERERGEAEEDDLRRAELAARQLARRCPRIARVDPGVDQPVQPHRERPRTDHRERDAEQIVRARNAVNREEGADVRERQREDRVLDLDEPRETRGQGSNDGRHRRDARASPYTVAMPSVAAVIVNYNGGEFLDRALAALESQTVKPARTIVVDNASTDGSVDGLEDRHPGVEVLRLEENTGFAAANNRAVRLADDCEFVALVNPDAFAEPRWLETLLEAA